MNSKNAMCCTRDPLTRCAFALAPLPLRVSPMNHFPSLKLDTRRPLYLVPRPVAGGGGNSSTERCLKQVLRVNILCVQRGITPLQVGNLRQQLLGRLTQTSVVRRRQQTKQTQHTHVELNHQNSFDINRNMNMGTEPNNSTSLKSFRDLLKVQNTKT